MNHKKFQQRIAPPHKQARIFTSRGVASGVGCVGCVAARQLSRVSRVSRVMGAVW